MIGLLFLAAFAPPPRVTINVPPPGSAVDCRTGPTKREFGRFAWNIFACSDGKLLVLAAKGNPAFPAMLSISIKGHRAEVAGPAFVLETAGAAVAELKKLNPAEISQLRAEANLAASHR